MSTTLCDDETLHALMAAMAEGDGSEMRQIDRLLADYPEDPRLHFLRGSVLASIGRPIEALPALRRAVELAPEFAIARFQLGFFQLTSGEAAEALSTWGPLALLPENHYLRKFVAGLTHLIRDEFTEALLHLREGVALNLENPPLNRDIGMIIAQVETLSQEAAPIEAAGAGTASATSFLLDQLSGGGGGR